MRLESFKRAGRRGTLIVGAIAVMSLLSLAPWPHDQHPAQAQDVVVLQSQPHFKEKPLENNAETNNKTNSQKNSDESNKENNHQKFLVDGLTSNSGGAKGVADSIDPKHFLVMPAQNHKLHTNSPAISIPTTESEDITSVIYPTRPSEAKTIVADLDRKPRLRLPESTTNKKSLFAITPLGEIRELPASRSASGFVSNLTAESVTTEKLTSTTKNPVSALPESNVPTPLPFPVYVADVVGSRAGIVARKDLPSINPDLKPIEIISEPIVPPDIRLKQAADAIESGINLISTMAVSVSVQNPEIPELARALQYNADLIFEYVYNNIETLPQYGSLKGATGALLDGKGTAFDQAELMHKLLQASGYTTSFRVGLINLTAAQITNWLGSDNNINIISEVFGDGGFPGGVYASGNTVTSADIGWAWVAVLINGTVYYFDPATKGYNRSAPSVNLATATGYNQTTFLSRAKQGTVLTSTTIDNLNRTNIRNDLATYATNLATYLRTNNFNSSLQDVAGGATIVPLAANTQLRQTALPYSVGTPNGFTAIPDGCRSTLEVGLTGAGGTPFLFNSSDIYGHRLALFFNAGGFPVLTIDGTAIPGGTGGIVTDLVNYYAQIELTVRHPYYTGEPVADCNIANRADYADQDEELLLRAYTAAPFSSYIISNAWGPVGRGMVEKHRKLYHQNSAQQATSNPDAESVLGESLSALGYTWQSEVYRAQDIINKINGMGMMFHHNVGIVAMGRVGNSLSPYVDFPMNRYSSVALKVAQYNVDAQSRNIYENTILSSILESGVIEQTQPGATAVSTAKLLDIALQSDTVFDLDGSTTAGYNYYWNTVRPQLSATWSAADLNLLHNLMLEDFRAIVAKIGNQTVNQWTGTGIFYFGTGTNSGITGAYITGGFSGGFSTQSNPPPLFNFNTSSTVQTGSQSYTNTIPGVGSGLLGAVTRNILDPVSVVSGDFLYRHDDLNVGSESFPYGLTLQRSYDSGQRFNKGSIGLGWSHNYDITAKVDSDGVEGMGQNSPISAASALAAAYIIHDMFSQGVSTPIPLDRFAIASVTTRWLMDQLTNNIVEVRQPGAAERFVKLADGSYNPPIGSATHLHFNTGDNTYTYRTKDQQLLYFNSVGNLASWSFPSGPVVTLNYNTSNKLTSVSNGMGRALNFTYSGNFVSSVNDGNGRSVAYGRDTNNNLTSYSDALNNIATFTYQGKGLLAKIFYPSKPTNPYVFNTYDTLGRVMQQADARNNVTNFFLAGSRTQTNNPLGVPHVYYFNPRGQIIREVNEVGNVTTNTYDARDRLTKTTLPEGNNLNYTYDNKHNVLSIVAQPKAGSGLANITQSFTYHPTFNKVATATDANNKTTTYAYNATTGTLTSITQPTVGGQTPTQSYTYNTVGQVLTETDAVGRVTTYTYSNLNKALLKAEVDSNGLKLTTNYGYDAIGNVTSVTNPNGKITNTTYDNLRRVTSVTGPAGTSTVTDYTYDADHNVTQMRRGTGGFEPGWGWQVFTYTYTNSFKPLTATDGAGKTTTYAYNTLDEQSNMTDAQGRVTTYNRDVIGRLTGITNTAIQATPLEQYGYTANGLRASLTDARGNQVAYVYDGHDRLKQTNYPNGKNEAQTYDPAGNLLTYTNRAAQVMTYTYDALNRRVTKLPQGGSTISYTYDLTGRMLTAVEPGRTISFGYDTAGRNTSTTTYHGLVTYILDAAGNRTGLRWPDNYQIDYTYDALNRMTAVKQGTTTLASYAYDPLSRRMSMATGNGVSTAYTYTHNDDLTGVTHTFGAGGTVAFGYTTNNVHQRVSASVNNALYQYRPPAAANTNYAPNAMNQYATVGGTAQTYDNNGNLTAGDGNTYGYDIHNRLVSAVSGGVTSTYVYDALGRRRAKFVGSVGTGYLSANDQEIAEYSASFALLRRYIPGPGLDEPVARVDGSGTVNYLHTDGLGSVVSESSGSPGTIIIGSNYAYGVFGESATVAGGFIRYAGRRLDPETGLYHNRARAYSPKLGRFLQPDPSGPSDGPNLYAYATNDPLNRTDPSGLVARGYEASWNVSSTMLLRQSGMMGLNFDANYDAALPAFGYLRVNGTVGEQIGAWTGLAAGYAANTLGVGAAIGYSVNYAALWAAGKTNAVGTGAFATNNVTKNLSVETQRGIRSLEKRIAEHETKLADFKSNPTVRPGMEGQPKEVIQAAQQSRIRHLEKEIQTFKDNIDKLKGGQP